MSHDHTPAAGRIRLAIALALAAAVLLAELVGAGLSGSLALLADAGHVGSDIVALGVALVATVIAARPATDRHSYGFRRMEVLAALVNGVLLVVVAASVAIEGARRLLEPRPADVDAGPVLVVAAIGLVASIVALGVLRGGDRTALHVRSAYLEVLGDAAGAIAALVGGTVVLATGWSGADALASLVIAALIVPRAVVLLRDVVRVLTESTPREVDVEQIRAHVLGVSGVVAVHDVHVWAITHGAPVFSAHVVVAPEVFARGEAGALLDRLTSCLSEHFDVEHSTFQLEPVEHARHEEHAHR